MRFFVAVVLGCLVMSGCGQPSRAPRRGQRPSHQPKRVEVELTPKPPSIQISDETPQSAAASFLRAVQVGDAQAAFQLLTSEAQQASRDAGLVLLTPGCACAEFRVGRVAYFDDDRGAYVECLWSGGDALKLLLVEKREADGWRLEGLAVADPGGEHLREVINFAIPDELVVAGR